jgi:hypothetical protein
MAFPETGPGKAPPVRLTKAFVTTQINGALTLTPSQMLLSVLNRNALPETNKRTKKHTVAFFDLFVQKIFSLDHDIILRSSINCAQIIMKKGETVYEKN